MLPGSLALEATPHPSLSLSPFPWKRWRYRRSSTHNRASFLLAFCSCRERGLPCLAGCLSHVGGQLSQRLGMLHIAEKGTTGHSPPRGKPASPAAPRRCQHMLLPSSPSARPLPPTLSLSRPLAGPGPKPSSSSPPFSLPSLLFFLFQWPLIDHVKDTAPALREVFN